MTQLVLLNQKGEGITTSLIVAEVFGKQHFNVLQDISKLTCSQEFRDLNFQLSSYVSPQNKSLSMWELTKDGFSFLVMGYTGEKASKFKEDFIAEFNKRDALLKSDDYILQRAMTILNNKIKALEEQVEKDSLKVGYFDTVLQSQSTLTTTQIAKELGMSAMKLNNILSGYKIQYKSGGQWVLSAKYQDKSYTKNHTTPIMLADGTIGSRTYMVWTESGRAFIHSLIPQTPKLI